MFMLNFWGGAAGEPPLQINLFPVRSTMLVTVFVFLGIEGASIYSRYATNRKDVGGDRIRLHRGAVLTDVSHHAFLWRYAPAELGALRQPSMAGVLESIVGRWGMIFISVGLIISVLGAYLSGHCSLRRLFIPRR